MIEKEIKTTIELEPLLEETVAGNSGKAIKIGLVANDRDTDETRFLLTPEGCGLLTSAGFHIIMEEGAATDISFPDSAYAEFGVEIGARTEALKADVVLSYESLSADDIKKMHRGTMLLTMQGNHLFDAATIKRSRYTFCLLGGEPTLDPNFLHILKTIHSKQTPVFSYTVTNASRSINFFKEYAEMVKGKNHDVLISYHPVSAKFDDIAEKVKILAKNGVHVSFNYMFYIGEKGDDCENVWINEHKNTISKFAELRKEIPFEFSIVPLVDFETELMDERFTPDILEQIASLQNKVKEAGFAGVPAIPSTYPKNTSVYIYRQGNRLCESPLFKYDWGNALKKGLRSFSGFHCCSGVNEICIDTSGSVFGGKCSQLNKPKANIYKEDLKFRDIIEIVHCNGPTCICPSNDPLAKFRDKKEAEDFVNNFIENYLPN